MEALWNPWLKPRVFTTPTNIEANNKKLSRKKVKAHKRFTEMQDQKQLKDASWDALEQA